VFSHAPNAIADFRLRATLVVMLVMMGFVFLKQRLLNAEMLRLLEESRESFDNLKKMQDQLVNSEKLAALGQLVAGAAHEINNPLTAILGYSDLMISDSRTGERSRGIAEKIAQQARRTKRLVANMLSFAQQQPATKQWVQVNTLLNNVLQLREPDLTGKKIRVTTSLDLDLPEVWGDSNHLLQVFLHILNNAVDALQEVGGGIVTVSTSQADGFVSAGFSDTGHGVKDPSRIFDPFYTTKPVGKGTGLGLSVCYGIVQEHGGEIVYHNNESGGATFVVKLPARKEQVSSPEAVAMSAGDE
jgi:two-component system NtrC family sensor kinase